MGESFRVGELAELVYSRYHRAPAGTDVVITGPLDYRLNNISRQMEQCYAVEVEGEKYLALPNQLRKKRPPQDWVKLCNLTNLSTRLQHEVGA